MHSRDALGQPKSILIKRFTADDEKASTAWSNATFSIAQAALR
jgi:hypothetical protein